MTKKRLILDIDDDVEYLYLLGLVSSSAHLELVHTLNQSHFFNFFRSEDLCIEKKGEANYFIKFESEDPDYGSVFIIKSRGINGLISREARGFDYLLGTRIDNELYLDSMTDYLRRHNRIQALLELESESLKDKIQILNDY